MIPHSKPSIGDQEIQAVERVLRSGHLAQGAQTTAFEEECAALLGRRHAVAVNSGTAALHLALSVLDIDAADAVAFPSYACAAILQAVCWQKARPVLCDIGADYNLNPFEVPWNAAAVIVPHLFGCPARLPSHACIIEDIAQSMGNGTGRTAPVAITSFYATKLLTTGEGGMLFTDDLGLAQEARDRRDYDNRTQFRIRYAYKITDFQAAMGRVQLTRLPGFIERRRTIAARYDEAFRGFPMQLPLQHKDHAYFRYVIAVKDPGRLAKHLENQGIEAKRPVHHPAHHDLGGEYPNAEHAHLECLSLPVYPALTDQEIEFVVESVVKFFP